MARSKDNIAFWEERYATHNIPWDLGEVSGPVRRLVEGHFPQVGTVLIPGCGRGYEAIYLARKGYSVTAVDFVEAPLAFLREQAGREGLEIEVVMADLFDLPARYDGAFDVFLEQTCLCAIRPERWADYEGLAYRTLKPGGRLLGVFMDARVERGPPYACPPEAVRALFAPERWRFDGLEPQPDHPDRPGPEFNACFTRLGRE